MTRYSVPSRGNCIQLQTHASFGSKVMDGGDGRILNPGPKGTYGAGMRITSGVIQCSAMKGSKSPLNELFDTAFTLGSVSIDDANRLRLRGYGPSICGIFSDSKNADGFRRRIADMGSGSEWRVRWDHRLDQGV